MKNYRHWKGPIGKVLLGIEMMGGGGVGNNKH